MARTQKYPGVSLAAIKKFCRHCIKVNGDQTRRYRLEYAGLAEESGSYYLVDGFHMVRFRYDLPDLIHAEKKGIGSQPSMLHFIDNARQKCGTVGKSVEIELPALEEVKAAAAMNKAAKKRKGTELPFPLAYGRIWVNPAYLLDMMQIFPMQRVAVMTGNAYQPLYFGCDGADGILLPMRCDNPHSTMKQWYKRREHFLAQKQPQEEATKAPVPVDDDDFSDIDTVAVRNALEAGGESDFVRKVMKDVASIARKDNMGQPKNLSQLKRRLTVGAAFEINTITGELQKRRVIKAQTNAIVSIVPFDADHKVTSGGGNWMWFESAAKWRFSDGWCAYCGNGSDAVFSIRLIDTTQEEDEQYNAWMADLLASQETKVAQEQAEREIRLKKKKEQEHQEIESALLTAENAIHDRQKRIDNNNICGKCLVLRLAERYNITVPLRTAGWIAKNLGHFIIESGSTQVDGIRVWSIKKAPQGVCDILFAILHAVDAHFEEMAENSSADNSYGVDTSHSSGVSSAGNEYMPVYSSVANTSVSCAYKPIYGEYTKNLAGGHNTAQLPDTS